MDLELADLTPEMMKPMYPKKKYRGPGIDIKRLNELAEIYAKRNNHSSEEKER